MANEGNTQTARIEVSADALTAEIVVPGGVAPPDQLTILAMMAELKIELTAANNALVRETSDALAALGGGAARLPVARGVAPQAAMAGRIGFEPGYDPAEIEQVLQAAAAGEAGGNGGSGRPPGSVDHYSKSKFQFVVVGAHVATVVFPFDGMDGRDVFGNTIRPEPAKANNFSVDDTLKKCDDGRLIALRPGVLEWGEGGLHITDELVIPSCIDFSIGHIDFPGSVHVRGGVRDLFKVIAKTDLQIDGLIEAATIKAGRDTTIHGGMAAKEKGTLDVGRDATAKYLNNVTVSVGRDLAVDRELVNCRVTVGRAFNGLKCGIAGGALAVAGPIVVNTVGSEMGVATDLRLGSIPPLEAAVKEALALIPLLEARRAKHTEPLDQLKSVKGKHSPSTIERIMELEALVDAVNQKIRPLEERIAKLRATLRERTTVHLTVQGRVYPKVLITAGNYTIDFTKELKGPFRLVLDASFSPTICLLDGTPMGDLNKHAKVRRIDLAAGANSAARAA